MQSLPNYFFELFFGLMWGKSSEVVCIQTFKDSSNKHAMWTKKKWGACKASPSYKQDKHLLEGPPLKKKKKILTAKKGPKFKEKKYPQVLI